MDKKAVRLRVIPLIIRLPFSSATATFSTGQKQRQQFHFHLAICLHNFLKYAEDFSRVDDKSRSINGGCEGSVD